MGERFIEELDHEIDRLARQRYGLSGAEFTRRMAEFESIRECQRNGGRGWLPLLQRLLAEEI